MNIEHLVTMANQIGDFFASYPDQDEAKNEIASHLQRFWAPRMRLQLLAYIEQGQAQDIGLAPLVLAAIEANRVRLMPKAA